jgi:hypothetical protein
MKIMVSTLRIGRTPFVFGAIVVYADNVYAARQVYEQVRQMSQADSCGYVQLETGEQIDWLSLRGRAHEHGPSPRHGVPRVPHLRLLTDRPPPTASKDPIAGRYGEYDPNRLFDTLMHRLLLGGDDALSARLSLAPEGLSDFRSGRVAISVSDLMSWSRHTGIGTAELRRMLGDRRSSGRTKCIFLWADQGDVPDEDRKSVADMQAGGQRQS